MQATPAAGAPAVAAVPLAAFGAQLRAGFLAGMGRVRGRFVILLDVQRVPSLEAIGALQPLAPRALH